ncbi:MAG: ROK family protein [Terriglobales bacterium]|jgi:glucokinase
MSFAIGVDLGGTNLRIAAVSEQGELLEKITTGTHVRLGRDAVINEMTAAISRQAAKFSRSQELLGIGIGVPGIIDAHTGMLRESPNLAGWNDYPVRDEIERRLGSPVALENDANCAALGEDWLGAAKAADHMCMITLGTGVGGGIVLHGRVWHGLTGMAGELGHITVDPNGPNCPCGNRGCAEQFASATAIMRMAHAAIAGGKSEALKRAAGDPNAEFNSKAVYELAVQGDQAAQEIYHTVGWALGVLLGDLVNALNLQMYVIGGGVSASWEVFAPALFEELQRRSFVYAATAPNDMIASVAEGASATLKPLGTSPRTIITHAVLGGDAGLYGAARLPMLPVDKM